MNSNSGAWSALTVLLLINILNFYDRNVAGALLEPVRREFHLTDTQLGLMGSAFIWLYAIVGVPLGRLADSFSRKKLLAGGMVIWSSLTALAAVATSYPMLLFSRLGVGVGEAVVAPSATSWIGDMFPAVKRARALALFMLGVPVGGALSYFFSGPVAQAYGWRAAMVLAAAPALLLTPALALLREPRRGASEVSGMLVAEPGSIWSVLRIPTLWWIIASGALVNFNMYAIGTFLPAFLSRIHKLSLSDSGIGTGVVYMVGGVAGGIAAGIWGDRIVHIRKDGRLLSAAIVALVGAPLGWLGIIQPMGSVYLALGLLTLAYAALNTYYGFVYSSIQDIVAPAQRGRTMAIYFMAMYMCGASMGPLLTGNLSDRMARRAAGAGAMTEAARAIGLQQAMLIIPILSAALGLVLYLGSRTVSKDMARLERRAKAAA